VIEFCLDSLVEHHLARRGRGNKKARLSQTGLEYLELKGFRSLDLTYLSRYIHRDGVGTLLTA